MATGVYPPAATTCSSSSSSSSPSSSPSSSYYYYDCLYHTWPLMYTHTRLPATTTTTTATTTTMTVFTTHGHFYIPNTRLPATVLLPSYAILYACARAHLSAPCILARSLSPPHAPLHPLPLPLHTLPLILPTSRALSVHGPAEKSIPRALQARILKSALYSAFTEEMY